MYYFLSYFCQLTGQFSLAEMQLQTISTGVVVICRLTWALSTVLPESQVMRLGCLYNHSPWAPHSLWDGSDWDSEKSYSPNSLVSWLPIGFCHWESLKKDWKARHLVFSSVQLKQTCGFDPSYFFLFLLKYNLYSIIFVSGAQGNDAVFVSLQ